MIVIGGWRKDTETGNWHVFVAGKVECVAGTVVEVMSQGGKCTKLIIQKTIKPIKGGNLYHCKSFENSEIRPVQEESPHSFNIKPEAKEIEAEASTEVGMDELDAALGLD